MTGGSLPLDSGTQAREEWWMTGGSLPLDSDTQARVEWWMTGGSLHLDSDTQARMEWWNWWHLPLDSGAHRPDFEMGDWWQSAPG